MQKIIAWRVEPFRKESAILEILLNCWYLVFQWLFIIILWNIFKFFWFWLFQSVALIWVGDSKHTPVNCSFLFYKNISKGSFGKTAPLVSKYDFAIRYLEFQDTCYFYKNILLIFLLSMASNSEKHFFAHQKSFILIIFMNAKFHLGSHIQAHFQKKISILCKLG